MVYGIEWGSIASGANPMFVCFALTQEYCDKRMDFRTHYLHLSITVHTYIYTENNTEYKIILINIKIK